jgi:hypothetical protein
MQNLGNVYSCESASPPLLWAKLMRRTDFKWRYCTILYADKLTILYYMDNGMCFMELINLKTLVELIHAWRVTYELYGKFPAIFIVVLKIQMVFGSI